MLLSMHTLKPWARTICLPVRAELWAEPPPRSCSGDWWWQNCSVDDEVLQKSDGVSLGERFMSQGHCLTPKCPLLTPTPHLSLPSLLMEADWKWSHVENIRSFQQENNSFNGGRLCSGHQVLHSANEVKPKHLTEHNICSVLLGSALKWALKHLMCMENMQEFKLWEFLKLWSEAFVHFPSSPDLDIRCISLTSSDWTSKVRRK